MVKPDAHVLWQELNARRYVCKKCRFRSSNHAHYDRHWDSSKHFLLNEFREECPNDLKILIASFLPFSKLVTLGRNGVLAVNLAWPRPRRWNHLQIQRLHRVVQTVGLPSQNVAAAVFPEHTWQTPVASV